MFSNRAFLTRMSKEVEKDSERRESYSSSLNLIHGLQDAYDCYKRFRKYILHKIWSSNMNDWNIYWTTWANRISVHFYKSQPTGEVSSQISSYDTGTNNYRSYEEISDLISIMTLKQCKIDRINVFGVMNWAWLFSFICLFSEC